MAILQYVNLLICTLAALATSELVLKGSRVQSALGRVIPVHAMAGLISMVTSVLLGNCFLTGLGLFWAGEFLCWFGLRSHLESSILLRMLVLLKAGSCSTGGLVREYLRGYGPAERVKELREAGLISDKTGGMVVTQKGKKVLKISRFLGAAIVQGVQADK